MEVVLLIWLPLCIAVAILASRYNRSGFGWFLFSVVLSPLLGFAFVLACGPLAARPVTAESEPEPEPDTRTWLDRYADVSLAKHRHHYR